MPLRFALLAAALCAASPASAQDPAPIAPVVRYDDTAIKARLNAHMGAMFIVMPGEIRAAVIAADGDLVRASPDLDLIVARYRASTERMTIELVDEAEKAARMDPSRFAADAAPTAAAVEMLNASPGWVLGMVGARMFEGEEPEDLQDGLQAALAFGRQTAALTAALRSASGPEESQGLLTRAQPGADAFAGTVASMLRANVEAGAADEAAQTAAFPIAADIVRSIPNSILGQLGQPTPPAGSALALMYKAQSEMLLEQLKELGMEMVQAITDNRADPQAADAALDALIAGRQTGIATLVDRTLTVLDAWKTVAENDRSEDDWVMNRLFVADTRDLAKLRAWAEEEAAGTD